MWSIAAVHFELVFGCFILSTSCVFAFADEDKNARARNYIADIVNEDVLQIFDIDLETFVQAGRQAGIVPADKCANRGIGMNAEALIPPMGKTMA